MTYPEILDRLRQNLWLFPALTVLGSIAAALGMVALDAAFPEVGDGCPLLFQGGAESARGILAAIAGSTITIAGVTFSITMVVLQLTSTQFSPRVLRNFMRDRGNQLVLSAFIGTFTYSMVVLGTVRTQADARESFVPAIALTGSLVLVLVALGMFIYFIHHIASSIQVSHIAAAIAREALDVVQREYPDPLDPNPSWTEAAGTREWRPRAGTRSGYVELIDAAPAVKLAADHDVVVRFEVAPGEWLQAGAPLFSVSPPSGVSDELTARLERVVTVGKQRSMHHDIAFAIQQLVDVALRAISPGINDPTTAMTCIDRLTEILVAVGPRDLGDGVHRDACGEVRVLTRPVDFRELVNLAFDQIRHFAGDMPSVLAHVAGRLTTIASAVPADRHGPLAAQGELVAQMAATNIAVQPDRDRVHHACEQLFRLTSRTAGRTAP